MEVQLDTPIQYLKGVGPHYAKVFQRRGILTVDDLLQWYPRAYEDRRVARSISSLKVGEVVSLRAEVAGVQSAFLGRSRRKIYDVVIKDETGRIRCKFFRVPFKGYFERLHVGKKVRVVGKVVEYRSVKQFQHPDIKDLDQDEANKDEIVPIYTETEGVTPQRLRKVMTQALSNVKKNMVECLPQWILQKYNLPTRREALIGIHSPQLESGYNLMDMKSPFHRRIIFEEFFWLEMILALRHSGRTQESAIPMKPIVSFLQKMQPHIPFELTGAQKRTLDEILVDLQKPHPMHRLVQGDVGSGKTMVSLLSAIYVIKNGFQCALMVPTEILAEQHYKNATMLFEKLNLKVVLLTGGMNKKEKEEALLKIKNHDAHLVVGTHALIQDTVEFDKLGLVIIDEQHRFGVQQRQKLKQKGKSPHFLVMTATPIPRTLAMTVYGDLSVSVIDELPKGRSPIVTRVVFPNKRGRVMQFMREQIQKGRQAYVVYPLVEESEKMDLKDAVTEFEVLQKEFCEFNVGLLHGRMKQEEKDTIMNDFRDNKIQILVSTTVIEVGVDVANANLMLIEHAERFGLSQLHQLRGRVGRGEHKSYCVLMHGNAVSQESRERTQIMAETSDGFKIAEADLEIRGPGEFLGARQSGLTGFKMGNLVRDVRILQEAREAAFELVKRDPNLNLQEHTLLKEELKSKQNYIS